MYWFWYDLRSKPENSPEPDAIANISNFRYVSDLPSGDWSTFGSKLGIQLGFRTLQFYDLIERRDFEPLERFIQFQRVKSQSLVEVIPILGRERQKLST